MKYSMTVAAAVTNSYLCAKQAEQDIVNVSRESMTMAAAARIAKATLALCTYTFVY